jgi:hypothetical protein
MKTKSPAIVLSASPPPGFILASHNRFYAFVSFILHYLTSLTHISSSLFRLSNFSEFTPESKGLLCADFSINLFCVLFFTVLVSSFIVNFSVLILHGLTNNFAVRNQITFLKTHKF